MTTIRTVAVIGAGQMGSGIAQVVAAGGYEVKLYDIAPDRVTLALGEIAASLARRAARGLSTEAEAQAALQRVTAVKTLAEAAGADLVIEAASEDEAVKKGVFTELTPLLGPDVLHPQCRRFFTDKIYGFKADEPMQSLLFANTDLMASYRKLAYLNPLVGNIGLSLPLHLGFKNLYLMGLDNGFKSSDHHHSRYSMYYNESGETRNEFKQMALAQGDSILPGNFGGEVISNQLFAASVMMLEVAVKAFPDAHCHNCSDGAAITGAMPLHPADIDLEQAPVLDKQALRQYLLTEMSAPIDIERETIQQFMDVEFFNILLNKIKAEWRVAMPSRFALIQRMQTQMEYLTQVGQSRQRHIADVLFGSLNSAFTLITHLAYQIEDEQAALAAVRELLPLLDEFFDTMMALYAHGLAMVQGSHHHLLTRD